MKILLYVPFLINAHTQSLYIPSVWYQSYVIAEQSGSSVQTLPALSVPPDSAGVTLPRVDLVWRRYMHGYHRLCGVWGY